MKLSENTKKLFDAPFAVMGDSEDYTKFNVIIHSRNSPRYSSTIASCTDQKTAIRFARLPELYEALIEAKNEIYIMLNEWALGKSEVEYLESYQKRKGRKNHEFFNEIQELLNKVQEGK